MKKGSHTSGSAEKKRSPWLLLLAAAALAEESRGLLANLHLAPVWTRVSTYAFLLIVLELFSVTGEEIPFVYFQF